MTHITKIKHWVIIPAAGIGLRFGGNIPKQYISLYGKPVIEHTIAKFLYHPKIEKIIICLHAKDCFWQQFKLYNYTDKILVTTGGALRSHSVYAGIQAIAHLASPQDFVLVHDAVRPCISHVDIDKLISEAENHPVGAILGVRVRDCLKHSNQENEIISTLSRENVWQALTPQMFRYQLLKQALEQAIRLDNKVNDEASAIELLGFVPTIVEGRRDNIKITFPEDLLLAEKFFLV